MAPANLMAAIYVTLWLVVIMNVGIGVFNLIPLPPMDGYKVLVNFLSHETRRWFDENMSMLTIIILLMFLFGFIGRIVWPIADLLISGMNGFIYLIYQLII